MVETCSVITWQIGKRSQVFLNFFNGPQIQFQTGATYLRILISFDIVAHGKM